MMEQLLGRLLAGATELLGKSKGKSKVVPSSMTSLENLSFQLQAEAVKRLIKGACDDKTLLSK